MVGGCHVSNCSATFLFSNNSIYKYIYKRNKRKITKEVGCHLIILFEFLIIHLNFNYEKLTMDVGWKGVEIHDCPYIIIKEMNMQSCYIAILCIVKRSWGFRIDIIKLYIYMH